jgi:hypothetical protein
MALFHQPSLMTALDVYELESGVYDEASTATYNLKTNRAQQPNSPVRSPDLCLSSRTCEKAFNIDQCWRIYCRQTF